MRRVASNLVAMQISSLQEVCEGSFRRLRELCVLQAISARYKQLILTEISSAHVNHNACSAEACLAH